MTKHILKVLILVALALTLATSALSAQEQTTDTPPAFVPSESLLAQIERLEAYTIEQRGLELTFEIERLFPTRAEVIAFIEQSIADPDTLEALALSLQFYRAFDLIEEDIDLVQIVVDLLGDQVAGLYDPETRRMKTITLTGEQPGERLLLLEQIVYVHEFTHALQDANFGLESLLDEDAAIENPDRALAITALIEGDATAMMNDFTLMALQDNPLAAIGLLGQAAVSGIPEGIPQILIDELTMPYIQGEVFVRALIAEGGWERVNAAYLPENLPQSTEQILHPEKYLAGELPIEVSLADDGTAALATLGEGWALLYDRPLGEFYLREYLKTQLPTAQAIRAARGWGGDRYQLFFNEDENARAWVMRIVWDTPADSDDFVAAYLTFGETRFGTTPEGDCWSGDVDALCFVREDADAVVISYAPRLDQAQALLSIETAGALVAR